MELTKEILLNNGFKTNHEERVLPTFYCYSDKAAASAWRIQATSDYLPMNNVFTFNLEITRSNEKGSIVKRATLTDVRTVEDLNAIMALCGINKEVK
ncbi:MAG: hypothetical protein Q4D12_03375 [Bacteroidales bacterium]|nr:hypothetical protein [Bacteroidales bacterium]